MAEKKEKSKKKSMLPTLVWGAGAVLVGAGAYIIITRKEQDSIYNRILLSMGKEPLSTDAVVIDTTKPTQQASANNNNSGTVTDYRTLYSRSPKDLYTEALQKFLNEKANAGLVVDALYGGKTKAAADAYMKAQKIDGAELAKQVATWDGKVSKETAVVPSGSFSFPQTYTDGKKYDSVKALQAKLNQLGFKDYENKALVEDGVIGYRTGSAMFKAGFKPFETVRAGVITIISVAKLPITQETYNKFVNSGLGQITANDVVVIGDKAIVYDTNNQPQKHYVQNAQGQYEQRVFAQQGMILGKVQGSDELSYLFITTDGKLRKVRKSQAALAIGQ